MSHPRFPRLRCRPANFWPPVRGGVRSATRTSSQNLVRAQRAEHGDVPRRARNCTRGHEQPARTPPSAGRDRAGPSVHVPDDRRRPLQYATTPRRVALGRSASGRRGSVRGSAVPPRRRAPCTIGDRASARRAWPSVGDHGLARGSCQPDDPACRRTPDHRRRSDLVAPPAPPRHGVARDRVRRRPPPTAHLDTGAPRVPSALCSAGSPGREPIAQADR